MDVPFHELLVVEPFLDNHVEKTHSQGRICPRTKLEPQVSPLGKKVLSRVYDDKSAPLLVGSPEVFCFVFIRIGPEHAIGPNHDALGFTLIVTDGQVSAGDQGCPNTGDVTHVSRCEYIRCAQEVGKPIKKALIVPARPLTDDDGLGTNLLDDALEAFTDRIQGFIPRYPLPSFFALFHGMKDPIRMIGQLSDRQPFGTHSPTIDRRIRITFHPCDLAILDIGVDAAAAMATATRSPNPFYLSHCYLLPSNRDHARFHRSTSHHQNRSQVPALRRGVVTPQTPQLPRRAPLEQDSGSNSRALLNGTALCVEDHDCGSEHLNHVGEASIRPFSRSCSDPANESVCHTLPNRVLGSRSS